MYNAHLQSLNNRFIDLADPCRLCGHPSLDPGVFKGLGSSKRQVKKLMTNFKRDIHSIPLTPCGLYVVPSDPIRSCMVCLKV